MVRNIEYKFDSYKESQGRNAGSSPVSTTFNVLVEHLIMLRLTIMVCKTCVYRLLQTVFVSLAERLGNGLQNRLDWFNSNRELIGKKIIEG